MISKEFKEYLEDYFQNIYDTIPWHSKATMNDVLEAHDKLLEEWAYYFEDTDVWDRGYSLICESIGDCYFMFNTDAPEQNCIGFELIKLLVSSNDRRILKMDKEYHSWLKKEEVKQDFDEHKETKFVPSFRDLVN